MPKYLQTLSNYSIKTIKMSTSKQNAIEYDQDDFLSDIFMVESKMHVEGFREGFEKGQEKGLHEGYKLGVQEGTKLGSEIGFYKGFVQMWLHLTKQDPNNKPRTLQVMESLQTLLNDLDLGNPGDPDLQSRLSNIRSKFKQAASLVNMSPTFGSEATGMSF